ncbi:Hypothetical predicted protein [Cloeon dipterum]|uniref:Uncharacterized protein n=1 Tax=Cloeon dipterum TaxID=197152 RepID=A0A8S1DVY3_9INSE|nr:Hypothetical predicted protein [Cloeon dipterum]
MENLFEWQGPRKPFPPRLKCGVVAPDEVINSYLAAPSAGNATPRPEASSTTPLFLCRQLHVSAASREGADEGARIDVKDKKVLEPCLLAKMLEDHAMAQLQRLIGPATTVPTRASTFKKPLTTT